MDAPKPLEPRPEIPRVLAPKSAVAAPTLALEAEEGEILSDKVLPSLKGKELGGASSIPPPDSEVEMLESAVIDETGKIRFLEFCLC